MGAIIKLSWQSIKYYKAQALSILFSIIISVALTVGISSLVYSGELSNMENQRNLYGDYHYYLYAEPGMADKLENSKSTERYTLQKVGTYTVKGSGEEQANFSFAYGDEEYLSMTNRTIREGTYPVQKNEIAMDSFSLRNLGIDEIVGKTVTIGKENYILSGIISDAPATYLENMVCFVSKSFNEHPGKSFLYLKFDESRNLVDEVTAFMEDYGLSANDMQGNEKLNECLYAGNLSQLADRIKWMINEPDANFTTLLLTLRYEFKLTSNVIAGVLCLFSIFIIYSIFNVSVLKRLSQYGIMESLGINHKKVFFTLLAELLMLFIIGYPIGCFAGGTAAKMIYSKAGNVFVGSGAIFQQSHTQAVQSQTIGKNLMERFSVDKASIVFSFAFLLALLLLVCLIVMRKIRKITIVQMLGKQSEVKGNPKRKIYSKKNPHLTNVLTRKFMFSKKSVFLGIAISLSLGGVLFLGTTFVVKNTELNNTLTLKSDDGLHSDCQIYMESTKFNEGISQDTFDKMKNVEGIAEIHPTKYFLGEVSIAKDQLVWKEYFPEIANDPTWKQSAEVMSRFNGICVESDSQYKIKTNLYGYDDKLLEEMEDYKLEGIIDSQAMLADNTVILRTLVDSQNNSDGLHIKAGDTIKVKVPKKLEVQEGILRFDEAEELYTEKEFRVSAVVNRVLSKNDIFIKEEGLDIIMTNEQMQKNYGIDVYNMVNIIKQPDVNNEKALQSLQSLVKNIPNCIVKDYSAEVKEQSLYLKQKTVLFYGIAVIILVIGLFHIINSMSYLVLSRKREFGIMRAMGITDRQFYRMMVREGFFYGCIGTAIMLLLFSVVQKILTYMMQHVYLYVSSIQQLDVRIILGIAFVNIAISITSVLIPARQTVKESIIREISI